MNYIDTSLVKYESLILQNFGDKLLRWEYDEWHIYFNSVLWDITCQSFCILSEYKTYFRRCLVLTMRIEIFWKYLYIVLFDDEFSCVCPRNSVILIPLSVTMQLLYESISITVGEFKPASCWNVWNVDLRSISKWCGPKTNL